MQFFTATILHWLPLLRDNKFKEIIVDSLNFLSERNRVKVYGFVIMPNHIHLIWKVNDGHKLADVQRDFLKFSAQQFKFVLHDSKNKMLDKFKVNLKDRKYQFWQRNAFSIDLWSRKVVEQKLDYINANPVSGKWNLAEDFVQYPFSSASFYEEDDKRYPFLIHYMEEFGG